MKQGNILDRLEDARIRLETYHRRLWWLGVAVAASASMLAVGIFAGITTDWQDLPPAVGVSGGAFLLISGALLCVYVYSEGSDGYRDFGPDRVSPRTELRKLEREYRDSMLKEES